MILDTGATNTTIDSNTRYLLGYDVKDNIGSVEIETTNGIIEIEVFETNSFTSLGNFIKHFGIYFSQWLFSFTKKSNFYYYTVTRNYHIPCYF